MNQIKTIQYGGLLSIVMPVYNEKATIEKILERVCAVELNKEIIIVDDGSADGTQEILKQLEKNWQTKFSNPHTKAIRFIYHGVNAGKGAALRTGFSHTSGDIVIVQDADMEYEPNDYFELIEPILRDGADVVYGSRFVGADKRRVHLFWHDFGNKILTFLSNMLNNLNLTDMETGYKVFRAETLKKIQIKSNRFEVEPELTAKIAKMNCCFYEVPIAYRGRGYNEGKKITWRDGVTALWTIFKYKWTD